VHDLRPDDGLGSDVGELAALVHHAYLFWRAGTPTLEVPPAEFESLLRGPAGASSGEPPPEFYVQFPERRLWADVGTGASHEPLDGCFLGLEADGSLTVLAAFGIRGDRPGLTVAEVAGPRPGDLARPDGSPPFAPLMAGGAPAGLASLLGGDELLELGWRAWTLAAEKSRA
jgi:hypothetical protein